MYKQLRFGIVGTGMVAQVYGYALENCHEATLVAVADSNFASAENMAKKWHCAAFDGAERMADSCDLDAVVVCTPPVTHPEICVSLLKRRLHVLCEKPLSIDLQQALFMLETAFVHGVKLTMASKFRYVDDVIRAKEIVVAGVLGELVLFENVFASRVNMASRWNAIPAISGGGVLIDNGTHSVDLMRYFLGPLAEVHVLEGKRCQGLPVEETVTMFVRSVAGVLGSIDLSWSISKQRESYLDIYGSLGAISVGWKESRYLDYAKGEWVPFGQGYDKVRAFRSQIENFSRSLRGAEELLIHEEDALASVNVVQAAYEAMRQNHWIPIPGETPDVGRKAYASFAGDTYPCNAD